MTFLTLLASFLVLELLKTVGWHTFPSDFQLFWTSRVPTFPTLFEKVTPMSPLRPNRSVENDPILILSISGFHQKWPIYWYTRSQVVPKKFKEVKNWSKLTLIPRF